MGYVARLVWLGLVGPLLLAAVLHARTMYVSDTFEVVVRSEKEIAGRNIVRILPTGTALEVIDTDDSWATIKLSDGRIAYVLKRYLISRLPYKLTAERLQEEAEQQKTQLDTLETFTVTFICTDALGIADPKPPTLRVKVTSGVERGGGAGDAASCQAINSRALTRWRRWAIFFSPCLSSLSSAPIIALVPDAHKVLALPVGSQYPMGRRFPECNMVDG